MKTALFSFLIGFLIAPLFWTTPQPAKAAWSLEELLTPVAKDIKLIRVMIEHGSVCQSWDCKNAVKAAK